VAMTADKWSQLIEKEWVPIALSQLDALESLFMHACRHFLVFQQHQHQPDRQRHFMQLATRYKLACLRAVNEAISEGFSVPINDTTVATVVLLGFDEVGFLFHVLPSSSC
jgi:hypothetical protein